MQIRRKSSYQFLIGCLWSQNPPASKPEHPITTLKCRIFSPTINYKQQVILHLYVFDPGASFYLRAERWFPNVVRRETELLDPYMVSPEPEYPRTGAKYRIFSTNSSYNNQAILRVYVIDPALSLLLRPKTGFLSIYHQQIELLVLIVGGLEPVVLRKGPKY